MNSDRVFNGSFVLWWVSS